MKSDWIRVMDATGYAIFVVLCTYIGVNAYYHLIDRDDEKHSIIMY